MNRCPRKRSVESAFRRGSPPASWTDRRRAQRSPVPEMEDRMKRILLSLAAMAAFAVALPVRAGNGIDLNGTHYNLNIVGVEYAKKPPMNGADGHTIFVALGSKDSAP